MSKQINAENLDTLSAIWILACNDETPLMTYIGIQERLGLNPEFDVRTLIRSRPELFRLGVPSNRLETWKQALREGKHHPGWLKKISNAQDKAKAIDGLSEADIFRSQFRTTAGAPKSEIEILKWGLEHIDRLRKAQNEGRDASVKQWQMWLVFAVGLLGIAVQFIPKGENRSTPPVEIKCLIEKETLTTNPTQSIKQKDQTSTKPH